MLKITCLPVCTQAHTAVIVLNDLLAPAILFRLIGSCAQPALILVMFVLIIVVVTHGYSPLNDQLLSIPSPWTTVFPSQRLYILSPRIIFPSQLLFIDQQGPYFPLNDYTLYHLGSYKIPLSFCLNDYSSIIEDHIPL